MDWTRHACVLLVTPLLLWPAVDVSAQPAPLVETRLTELSIPVTVQHSLAWTASPSSYRNARELVVILKQRLPADGQEPERNVEVVEARLLITSEPRKSRADALKRLSDLAAEHGGAVNFVEIGGWPAAEIAFVERLTRRGSDPPPPAFGHRAITAVAAGDLIVRFEVSLIPGGRLQLLPEAQAIARSAVFPTRDTPAALKQNLRELDRKLRERRSQYVRPAPARASKLAAGAASMSQAASGVPVPVHGGLGELEIAASADAANIVIASNFKVAFSADRGSTFTPSDPGPFPNSPTDPTVTRGASGNFYLGTLARPDGSIAHLQATGCTNAVNRSTDGGATFALQGYSAQCPQTGTGMCFPDQPHIAADTVTAAGAGNEQLYAVWRSLLPTGIEPECAKIIITPYRPPMISCSQNNGVNWTAGATIPGAGDFPRVAIGGDGSVFVVSLSGDTVLLNRFTSCLSGLTAVAGYPVTVRTLTGQVACPVAGLDRCNDGNTLSSPTVATDPADASHLFVAFAEVDGSGGEHVAVVESRDGGSTFPRQATISGAMPARRFMPWVCCTGGNAWVGWYDRRAALVSGGSNDLTDYFIGVARSTGGASPSLTPGSERQVTNNSDPQCASGWSVGGVSCVPRQMEDSESCSIQPQLAGVCRTASGTGSSNKRCDFSDGGCPSGESCKTRGGCPKYGDYNGIACAGNWVIAAWASATAPSGQPAAAGVGIYASPEYVGPVRLSLCEVHPQACVAPIGFRKDIIRVKCTRLPCIVIDPIPRNCLTKWTCPGCPADTLCPPFYHVVFDNTLWRWQVDLVDGQGRQVPHDLRRVGRNTVLSVRPLKAEFRDSKIGDYRLVFTAVRGIRPGVEYVIRARLEMSDKPVLDIERTGR
jgi:hypothetical protein